MNRFLGRFNEALKMFNEKNKYTITLESALVRYYTGKDTNLEECLSVADARMYSKKKKKRKA